MTLKYLIITTGIFLWALSITQAQTFTLEKFSNTQWASVSPYMKGCRYQMNMRVDSPMQSGDAIRFTTLFNSWEVAMNSVVRNGSAFGSEVGLSISPSSTDITMYNTLPRTFNNMIGATLTFTAKTGAVTNFFGFQYIPNQVSDNTNYLLAGTEYLQNVFGTGYDFITGPCNRDTVAPSFDHTNALINIDNINQNGAGAYRIKTWSDIFMNITDNAPNGNNNGDLGSAEYTFPGFIRNSNNQFGVDSGTLSITVKKSAYAHKYDFPLWIPSSQQTYTINSSDLVSTPWGTTWEGLSRNLGIQINNQNGFYTERAITITGTIQDRVNKWLTNNTQNFSYTFNAPRAPVVIPRGPNAGQTITLALTSVKLEVNDDWAGIDPDSINFIIDGVTYSPNSSGVTYTSGLNDPIRPWLGDKYIYTIPLQNPLPFGSTIAVRTTGLDLVGTTLDNTYSFENYACGGGLPIFIANEKIWGNIQPTTNGRAIYAGTGLTVSDPNAYIDGNFIIIPSAPPLYTPISSPSGWWGGGAYLVYLSGSDIPVYLTGETQIQIQTGEEIIRYLDGKIVEKFTEGPVIIRTEQVDRGEENVFLGKNIIQIQTGEVIKYITSWENIIYLQTGQDNQHFAAPETCNMKAPRKRTDRAIIFAPWSLSLILWVTLINQLKKH